VDLKGEVADTFRAAGGGGCVVDAKSEKWADGVLGVIGIGGEAWHAVVAGRGLDDCFRWEDLCGALCCLVQVVRVVA
jgi:hypothetical protein